jgi:hypothetical protein
MSVHFMTSTAMGSCFFDWAQISLDQGVDGCTPAKVLLLYQTNTNEDRALVWMAKHATANKLQQETNISACWKMDLVASTGLPNIVSAISIDKIKNVSLFMSTGSVSTRTPY